ncbi:MAG: hypothetical protein U5P41_03150 [Gammaproteobacteria bacterium]|nr:hypothetical protein [Gammaproteobacteria bacterium]
MLILWRGGVVPDKDSGWQKASISEGEVLFVRKDQGGVGILFKDATGEMTSPGNSNARTIVLRESETKLVILVLYPRGVAETYYLNRPNKSWYGLKLNMPGWWIKGQCINLNANKLSMFSVRCKCFFP